MNKKKWISLGVIVLMMTVLVGCAEVYDAPIGQPDIGVEWVQWIVERLAEGILALSIGGYYIVGLSLITLIIRVVGWPIYSKTTGMSTNMQFAQPELNKLQEKYQGKTDEASKRAMQLETMKIYKKYDINPLGCFLPFLQLPIFIAMYQAVRRIPLTDTYVNNPDLNFNFFGLDLLSIPEEGFNIAANWPFLLFALIVGLTMFFSQRYSMKKPEFAKNKKYETTVQNQTQNTMKYMTYFLTFMIMTVAYTSLGIAYYWVIGNGFQFLQTYVNRRKTAMKMEKMKEVA
jgi:YidC/Oxa1 family membrane protein insertase